MEPGAPTKAVVEIIPPYHLRIGKKPKRGSRAKRIALFVLLFMLVGGVFAGGLAYQFKWYQPLVDRYNVGTVAIKVKEADKFAVEGAVVTVNGKKYTTDGNGRVSISDLVAGDYKITVTKDGYSDAVASMTIKRGDNDVQYISLTKLPDKVYAVKGFVQDYVTGKALANVAVTLASKTVQTDPAGAYGFENVASADIKLILSKPGYLDKELPVKVVDSDITTAKVPLVPSNRAVFVSNRDGGKRALYSSLYDGSDQKLFVEHVNDSEEFLPLVSSNGKNVIFASNRDKLVDKEGASLFRLYVVGMDGKDPKKVSDDADTLYATLAPFYSPDGNYLYYSAFGGAKYDQATYKVYSIAKGTTIDLGEAAFNIAFSPDSTLVAYVVNVAEDQETTTTQPDGSTVTSSKRVYVATLKTLNLLTGERKTLAKREAGVPAILFANDSKSISYETTVEGARKRFKVTVASGAEEETAVIAVDKRGYSVSPDGSKKAFVEARDSKTDLFVVAKDGSGEKKLTTIGTLNPSYKPVWDASGAYLTFAIRKDGETSLQVVAAEGGEPKTISTYYEVK